MFRRRNSPPPPQPAGFAVLCDVTLRHCEPGEPTGFFATVGVRTFDPEEAITRARAFLASPEIGAIRVEETQTLMEDEIPEETEVLQLGGRVFYGAAEPD